MAGPGVGCRYRGGTFSLEKAGISACIRYLSGIVHGFHGWLSPAYLAA